MELAASLHSEAVAPDADASIAALIQQHSANADRFFRKAVELGRDRVEPATFLYLGQLSNAAEAVAFYEQGLSGLRDELEVLTQAGIADDDDAIVELRRKMASVLCSITEIYMTDCCDEPQAEEVCTNNTAQAIQLDPHSPEAYQTLASVLLSKCMPDEALNAISHSLTLWSLADPNTWPSYPTRLATSKILMEVGKDDEAASVLETVLKENDEDLELWYLFAWCYYRMGGGTQCSNNEDEDMDASDDRNVPIEDKVEAFVDAKECLEKLLELAQKNPDEADPAMVQHASEMLQEVSTLVAQHPLLVKRIEEAHQAAEDDAMGMLQGDDDDEMEM
ncbi:hypothetical protein BCR33DRAFT_732997 [Rhizoclosmatium globosum]|uniref:TPR-like protein n=1 Tax=Rhizoclosmatium globosum TaxID=329046 RepID=A0A1Y2D1U3_9FUNG|nr:hypothetical protein BCR33DRAFT_732997 [Rhizoclosmatium globosum]|eukprot:ORY53252.1 hypothetical protein BCR33DRAFT_732997 [Rhizoclosmatium globosum]